MTEEERNELRQEILTEDKYSRLSDNEERITKLVYAMMQINDVQMNLHWELEKALGGAQVFYRNIKQKCTELKKILKDNSSKICRSGRAWSNLDSEQWESIGTDNGILELLVKKLFGLSHKVAFFGGCGLSIGQKTWAVNQATKRPMLVRVDGATAKVECRENMNHLTTVTIHCTRLNEKTAVETKDKYSIDSGEFFSTKDEAVKYLNQLKSRRVAYYG